MNTSVGTVHDPVPIWQDLSVLRQRIAAAKKLFLFLDFDGTLAPIVSVPSLAIMPDETKALLRDLVRPEVVPVIISGRAIDDLQSRIGLPLIYVGNHGLEIKGSGVNYNVPEADKLPVQMLRFCNRLRASLTPFAGALVECKQLTASVHVRQVDPLHISTIAKILQESIQNELQLRLHTGKQVFEIRPDILWNKGSAARWILEQIGGRESDSICIGDDVTDEDMFVEFSGGITLRVDCESLTAAHYRIGGSEVQRFLRYIRDSFEESHSPSRWTVN